MSDIFISYKREEQATARNLADALESEGWTVWWDPKLRAGERFNDVIEKALKESKCVVVMWSERSVESLYIKDEATYALNRNKLVPVMIEEVELPFRFEGLHTPSLLEWDGSPEAPGFRRLVEDIAAIVGPPATERQQAQLGDRQESNLEPGRVFRDTLKDGSQGPEMVEIPAGPFRMGDIDSHGPGCERPVHTVRIVRPFGMGQYQVTFEEYDRFTATTGHQSPLDKGWGRGRQPVINVSWEDAVEYARWLFEQTGKRYRLATEAEWEYAARAGTETKYWWGNQMKPRMGNWDWDDSHWAGKQTSPVGSFPPNPFALYDTIGNVWEWVQDCWHNNYNEAPADGSAWEQENGGNCHLRVIRGGSWYFYPGFLRSSFRYRHDAGYRDSGIGFRLAQDLD